MYTDLKPFFFLVCQSDSVSLRNLKLFVVVRTHLCEGLETSGSDDTIIIVGRRDRRFTTGSAKILVILVQITVRYFFFRSRSTPYRRIRFSR